MLRVRRLPDPILSRGMLFALGQVQEPVRTFGIDSQVNVVINFAAADVVDRYARATDVDSSPVSSQRVPDFPFQQYGVGIRITGAFEHDANIDIVVAVERPYASVHRVAALVEGFEVWYVVRKTSRQRANQRIALCPEICLFVALAELDARVELVELGLDSGHVEPKVYAAVWPKDLELGCVSTRRGRVLINIHIGKTIVKTLPTGALNHVALTNAQVRRAAHDLGLATGEGAEKGRLRL